MKRPEQALQRAIVKYLQVHENQGKLMFFHAANGGQRSEIEAAIFKGLGVKAGASDLIIFLPGPNVALLELKAPGRKLTKLQIEFQERASKFGAHTFTISDVNAAIGTINALVKAYPVRQPDPEPPKAAPSQIAPPTRERLMAGR